MFFETSVNVCQTTRRYFPKDDVTAAESRNSQLLDNGSLAHVSVTTSQNMTIAKQRFASMFPLQRVAA
jgi:hypothetical protein